MTASPMDKAILCVEDEGVILMHLLMVLKKRYAPGWRVEGASDAESGMAVLEGLRAQGCTAILLLSDWLMPGLRGDDFIKAVHARFPDVRAIMISGNIDAASVTAELESTGLMVFLPKPLVVDDIYRLVDRVMMPTSAG